jgi:hypothetical protein
LGEFRDQMVFVGGWVPGLLLAGAREPHIGTLDIDLALDFQRLPETSYATLLRALTVTRPPGSRRRSTPPGDSAHSISSDRPNSRNAGSGSMTSAHVQLSSEES